jgi:hypothetical protein
MYYLKATSEEALFAALENAGFYKKVYSEFDEEGNPVGDFELLRVGQFDLDVIGPIFKPTGQTTTIDGEEVPTMEQLDGYHANIRGITPEQAELLPTIDAPANPVRMWAGD